MPLYHGQAGQQNADQMASVGSLSQRIHELRDKADLIPLVPNTDGAARIGDATVLSAINFA